MLAVVIGSAVGREDMANQCEHFVRKSGFTGHIIRAINPYYEMGCLEDAATSLSADRFLFLQDTVFVLTPEFWDHIPSQGSAWLFARPHMYLGVYETDSLLPLLQQFEPSTDKEVAIQRETGFCDLYDAARAPVTLWPDVSDHTALGTLTAFGRENLVLGNDLIIKLKGRWDSGVRMPSIADVWGVSKQPS